MKKVSYLIIILILLLTLITSVSAFPVSDVKLTGYVLDYTNTLSPNTISNLSIILKSLQDQNAAEYVIVIVNNTDGLPIQDYALKIGHNNIGGKDDKGLVTVVALDQREYYTAVGYGLEGNLNDAKIGRFQREELVPFFQSGDYGSGLVALALAIHKELLPDTNIAVTRPKSNSSRSRTYNRFNFVNFIIVFFVFRFIFASMSRKKGKGKGRSGNAALNAALIASMFMRGGNGGNFGGGSGGFGGFSGGGFGGGGAGGGW